MTAISHFDSSEKSDKKMTEYQKSIFCLNQFTKILQGKKHFKSRQNGRENLLYFLFVKLRERDRETDRQRQRETKRDKLRQTD